MPSRARKWLAAGLALVALGAAAAAVAQVQAPAAPQRPAPAARRPARQPEGVAHMYQVLGRKPELAQPWLRAWWVHRDASVGVAYAVVPKRVPMHVHLDADHVIVVLEGYAHVSVGGLKTVLSPGDVLPIPRGMAHEVQRGGVGRLLMLDVSTPPGDMAQTFWIESPEAGIPAGPRGPKPPQ